VGGIARAGECGDIAILLACCDFTEGGNWDVFVPKEDNCVRSLMNGAGRGPNGGWLDNFQELSSNSPNPRNNGTD